MQAPAEAVEATRGDPAMFERPTDSGNTLCVWNCNACGSSLFMQNSARPRIRTVSAGCLDQIEKLDVNAHIWVKRKLPWVQLPEEHRVFEEGADWSADYAHDITRYKPNA